MQKRPSLAPAVALIALALLMFAPAKANAAAVCSLSATTIALGAFSGSQVTVTGQITIHCTGSGTSNFTLKLSTGSGTYASRRMNNGASAISYNLYTDSAFTQIWGDGTGGTVFKSGQIVLGPPPSVDILVPVFAKIPTQAPPAGGSYLDSIVATLTCTSGGACPATTTFNVTANGQAACTISANNLNFGAYAGLQIDGAVTLLATCSSGAPYNIGLNQGVSAGATVTTRKMTRSGGGLLSYSLFTDASRATNWGNTVGTDTVPATGTGGGQTFTVFSRIPASQSVPPGAYADTITVTLTF
jgi:spore coat protein U-like protein